MASGQATLHPDYDHISAAPVQKQPHAKAQLRKLWHRGPKKNGRGHPLDLPHGDSSLMVDCGPNGYAPLLANEIKQSGEGPAPLGRPQLEFATAARLLFAGCNLWNSALHC